MMYSCNIEFEKSQQKVIPTRELKYEIIDSVAKDCILGIVLYIT